MTVFDLVFDLVFYCPAPGLPLQVDSFGRAVHVTVFDVLLARVRPQLQRLPELPEWKKESPAGKGTVCMRARARVCMCM